MSFTFNWVAKQWICQQVTDDDDPAETSDWAEQCDVWVFTMDMDMPNNPARRIGVGDTTDLSLAYAPGDLYAGYKKLSVNAGGVIDVLQGSTVVISGTDKEEKWKLRSRSDPGNPSTLTVKGVSPDQVTLLLQYTPDGSTIPCVDYNGKSIGVTVVGVNHVEIYPNSTYGWVDISGSTITVPKGMKYSFRATPNPVGAQWPSQRPVWTLNGNSIGSPGDTSVQVTFDSEGTKTLVAKCGATDTGKTVTINVILPVLNTVEYRQNHVLHNANPPEYQRSLSQNEPGCWTVGTRAEARVTFWHSSSLTYPVNNVVVRAETSGDSGNIGNWGNSASSTFGTNWPSNTITCVAEETINDAVEWQDYSAQWKYKCVDGTNQWIQTTNQTGCRLFVVLDTPTSPQAQPWKEALLIACQLAWGDAQKSVAMYDLYLSFYGDAGGSYDCYEGAPQYTSDGTTALFDLTGWLDVFNSIGTVNCYDMAKALVVFGNALGCGASNSYVQPFGYLNCVSPIGRDWTNNPFYEHPDYWPDPIVDGDSEDDGIDGNHIGRSWFGRHAFARLANGAIYDASVGVVDVNAPVDSPPCEEYYLDGYDTWSNSYRDRVIDDYPVSNPGSPNDYSFDVY